MRKVASAKKAPKESKVDTAKWLDILQKTEIRALASVSRDISKLIGDTNTSAAALAELILRDAALTSQVLKIANSVVFKPGASNSDKLAASNSSNESALRQSIIRIGFNGIRCICISIALIDSIVKNPLEQQRLFKCLAHSFHTAVHARNVAQKMKGCRSEDVFIAGLLQNLGEIVFWTSPIAKSSKFKALLKESDNNPSDAAVKLTGMSFTDMSKELANAWSLSETLVDSFNPAKHGAEMRAVNLGVMMSNGVEGGWESKPLKRALNKITKDFSLDIAKGMALLHKGADEAVAMANSYGEGVGDSLLPSKQENLPAVDDMDPIDSVDPAQQLREIDKSAKQNKADVKKTEATKPKNKLQVEDRKKKVVNKTPRMPDGNRQMALIEALWDSAEGSKRVGAVCKLMADGIFEAIGFERVAVFIKVNKKEEIKLAYLAGAETAHWTKDLVLPINERNDSIFRYCSRLKNPVWVSPEQTTGLDKLITKPVKALIGKQQRFVLAPIKSGVRVVALVYADMAGEELTISEQHFTAFSRFIKQASRALSSS